MKIDFPKFDPEGVKNILVKEHDFSLERVEKQFEKLNEVKKKSAQSTLF